MVWKFYGKTQLLHSFWQIAQNYVPFQKLTHQEVRWNFDILGRRIFLLHSRGVFRTLSDIYELFLKTNEQLKFVGLFHKKNLTIDVWRVPRYSSTVYFPYNLFLEWVPINIHCTQKPFMSFIKQMIVTFKRF